MREAVQYFRAAAEAVDRAPVVLLVQEETGLLAVFNIHDIADAVLGDLYFGIEGSGKEPFLPGHALKLADFGVAALVNAAHRNAVFGQNAHQRGQQVSLEAVDAEGQRFNDENILIFVYSQARQEIGFSEQETTAGSVDDLFPVLPCAAHPLCQKGRSYRIVAAAGEKADRDFGLTVDETIAHEISVEIFHRYDIAVLEISSELSDLVAIDPQTACLDGAAFSFFQDGRRVDGQVLQTVYVVIISVKR